MNHTDILRRLHDGGVEFVVIGGLAAQLHGSPIAANDVDICTSLDNENLRRIADALVGLNPKLDLKPGQHTHIHTDTGQVDVHAAVKGLGDYVIAAGRVVTMRIEGREIRVLDLDALLQSKRASTREKDRAAVEQLELLLSRRAQGMGNAPPPG